MWSSTFGFTAGAGVLRFGAAFKNPAENPPNPEPYFLASVLEATTFFGASFSKFALSALGCITLIPGLAALSGYFLGASLTSSTWSSVSLTPFALYYIYLFLSINSLISSSGGGISSESDIFKVLNSNKIFRAF